MNALLDRAESLTVTDMGERGRRIDERMKRLQISAHDLAPLVPMSRDTLGRVRRGDPSVKEATFRSVEQTLDRLEAVDLGEDVNEAGMVTFRISGNFGVDVVVQGPVANLAELEQSVGRLLRRMEESPDRSDDSSQ